MELPVEDASLDDFGGILSDDGGSEIDSESDNEDERNQEASHDLSVQESEDDDGNGEKVEDDDDGSRIEDNHIELRKRMTEEQSNCRRYHIASHQADAEMVKQSNVDEPHLTLFSIPTIRRC